MMKAGYEDEQNLILLSGCWMNQIDADAATAPVILSFAHWYTLHNFSLETDWTQNDVSYLSLFHSPIIFALLLSHSPCQDTYMFYPT